MYARPASQPHHAVSLAFAAARGFGLIVACDRGRPVASLLPFHLAEADGKALRATFHVAKGNPLADLAARGGTWLIVVAGADAYVSPDWYASRDQVPTWLYETVQLSGPVHLVPAEHVANHLDRLAAAFEAWQAPKIPWTAEKVTPARRDALMQAIVGIEMTVESVTGSFKLNQQKSDADHAAVVRALARQADPASRAISARMAAQRPHLPYDPLAYD
jgi:transcriptional regulator